ncbi:MAG: response regulator transcription factor [Actinobacteria bacterium]|nr:response regulator transcription factor [Actinomycetota bacterium]
MGQLKVMIVEDHPLMQAGIRKALERCDDMQVVGEASTGKRAAEIADNVDPDIIIMDVKLPDSDGITTMQAIKTRCKSAKVLMFSGFDDEHYVVRALESGANGYLLKNIGGNELADAVRQTANGLNPISPQLTGKVIPMARQKSQICERLTPREKEVWQLLSNGASNAEISKKLYVSESTVKFHIRNIFHKLGVKNRVEAARVAFHSIVAS